jgi:hypothetical protein
VLGSSRGGEAVVLPKDVNVLLPAGQLGNPVPFAVCTLSQFLTKVIQGGEPVNACPPETAIGVVDISVNSVGVAGGPLRFVLPLFNLEPAFGEPARFGFFVSLGQEPVTLDTSLCSGPGGDYGIDLTASSISQTVSFLSSEVTFWGTPGDPVHDSSRGWGCLAEARGIEHLPCVPQRQTKPPAFLTLPTSCSGTPLQSSLLADSWTEPGVFGEAVQRPGKSREPRAVRRTTGVSAAALCGALRADRASRTAWGSRLRAAARTRTDPSGRLAILCEVSMNPDHDLGVSR